MMAIRLNFRAWLFVLMHPVLSFKTWRSIRYMGVKDFKLEVLSGPAREPGKWTITGPDGNVRVYENE